MSGDVIASVRTMVSSNDMERLFCGNSVLLLNDEMISIRLNVSSNDMV